MTILAISALVAGCVWLQRRHDRRIARAARIRRFGR